MKNSEIHNGLPEKELREFLSNALVKNLTLEINARKIDVPYNAKVPYDRDIKDIEQQIVFLNKKLELIREKSSLLHIIAIKNWDDFDISDETTNDLPYRYSRSFIGTKDEYEQLLLKIKKEKE